MLCKWQKLLCTWQLWDNGPYCRYPLLDAIVRRHVQTAKCLPARRNTYRSWPSSGQAKVRPSLTALARSRSHIDIRYSKGIQPAGRRCQVCCNFFTAEIIRGIWHLLQRPHSWTVKSLWKEHLAAALKTNSTKVNQTWFAYTTTYCSVYDLNFINILPGSAIGDKET